MLTWTSWRSGQSVGKSTLKKLSPHSQPSTKPGWSRNSWALCIGLATT
ncbi:hypothetical protein STENM327S_05236 [Streptomyces tendae]